MHIHPITTSVTLEKDVSATPQTYFVSPEKLILGNPKQTLWIEYESPDKQFCVGVWASEVGEWRVNYSEEEYCCILEGRSVLKDAAGNCKEYSAGMEFVVPSGFIGTWQVVEPTRKRFVICEKSTANLHSDQSDA